MKKAVIAIGGNSLIKDKEHQSVPDQHNAVVETCEHIADLITAGYEVVITHGNGPQVGFILLRSEIASKQLHTVPLDYCGADTQGAIGYSIQRAMMNIFKQRGIKGHDTVTVVTQVLVDRNDPAFKNPSKPIGPFYSVAEAKERKDKEGWDIVEDAGRGWRRVVPSPKPVKILEIDAIKDLVAKKFTVVAAGGGGIPVIEKEDGQIEGIAAVIDKDYASSLLASEIKADIFIISTAVDKVYLNFGKEDQKALDKITFKEARQYMEEGHFKKGSMLPKVEAALSFLEHGGHKAIITNPENLRNAVEGKSGTTIVK